VILDLMLPRLGGRELCRALRQGGDVPVIMLTAKGEETDRIVGLELGADDYIVKPFSPGELVARVKAVLRRTSRSTEAQTSGESISAGDLVIDQARRETLVRGEQVTLTAKEFDLLHFLASHPGQVFSREQLMDHVWDYVYAGDASTVTVHIRRLREKIEMNPERPRFLKTVWGVGYKFEAELNAG
jgi:DNA-binding response OmpR family regulator